MIKLFKVTSIKMSISNFEQISDCDASFANF